MTILPHIVSQHAEEAAFLWLQRDRAVNEPHYRRSDLARLDERIEAHLDGLRVAGDEGWALLEEELRWEEPGEIFAAAVIALESRRDDRIQRALDAAIPEVPLRRAFASALGWSPEAVAEHHMRPLLTSSQPAHRHIAIMAAAVRRQSPESFATLLGDDDSLVRARAFRAVGELGRADLLASLSGPEPDDEASRFWCWWARGMLGGSPEVVRRLSTIAAADGPFVDRAVRFVFRLMPPVEAVSVINEWAKRPEFVRRTIVAAGVAGQPESLPWLIENMTAPETARVAGEAFSMITGADLAYLDLDRPKPEGFEPGPSENPEDENVALDPDENLPFPDVNRCRAWWESHRRDWPAGTRHLCGRPIRSANLEEVLRDGYQRQRAAAAVEQSLQTPGRILFEWRARGAI